MAHSRYLFDTHIILWVLTDDPRLPDKVRQIMEDDNAEIFYSVITPWEVEIKRLKHPDEISFGAKEMDDYCLQSGFERIPVRMSHVLELKNLKRRDGLPPHHDPFDRMLLSQAIAENIVFVTHDHLIAGYESKLLMAV